jgi:hypothetical protein
MISVSSLIRFGRFGDHDIPAHALEHLPDAWRASWVDKSVLDVPLGDRRQSVFQRAHRQDAGVVGEISRHAVPGRGQ